MVITWLNILLENKICVSIVLKAKTEKIGKIGWPPKKSIFEFWNKNPKKYVFIFFLFFKL